MVMEPNTSSRQQLLDQLRGQQVEIPDLLSLYTDWPSATNLARSSIEEAVTKILETYSVTTSVEGKLKNANLSLIVSNWYPAATVEDLEIITHFVCWMYIVDDSIIDNVSWPGQDNERLFDAARTELVSFVMASLGLDKDKHCSQPTSTNPAIDCFRKIGQILRQRYTVTQRRRFFQAFKLTMDGYRSEQMLRVAGSLPNWQEYWDYREGSCCMLMCVAMIEFASNLRIPDEIMENTEMRHLWSLTTQVSWLVNDIVSSKKELREGFIENAVALLAAESGRCQVGLDRTFQHEKQVVALFEKTADKVRRLAREFSQEPQLIRDVEKFIDGCKYICTGALTWR